MLAYELWHLANAYNQAAWRMAGPWLDNPIASWMVDRQVDAVLRLWFWPEYLLEAQDRLEEFQRFWLPTAGNLCKPQ